MSWNKDDKVACLCVLLEFASRLEPEEIFQGIIRLQEEFPGRMDRQTLHKPTLKQHSVAKCLRRCLETHGY